jgi:hypothetical protein
MPIRLGYDTNENAQYDPRTAHMEAQNFNATKVEKKRPLEEATDKLNAVVEELNHSIACLEQRLTPYLSPELPSPTATDRTPSVGAGSSQFTEHLGRVTSDLFLAISYIRRLTGRIE